MEVRPGLVCVLFFVDIKSDDYFSPCTHLSSAIPVNSEFGCWCIGSGCELSLQTCPCPLFCDFCSEMSLIHTRLSQLCSLWCVACCFRAVGRLCLSCARWKGSRRTCPSAARLSSWPGGRVRMCAQCNSWCRILLWEITRGSVGVEPCWPSYSVLS